MTANYGPRVDVHPDRQGSDRSDATGAMVRNIVLHTSEQSGLEDPNDAEDLARYLESPGDRPSSSKPSGRYGSSYHAITDTARILPCVVDHVVAYAAAGGNRYGLHICLPVKARQSRAEWLDAGSRPYIAQAAAYIVDKSHRYGIPIRRITADQLRNGSWGYCDHATVSAAFGRSTHTDCGAHFPWDVLADDIAALLEPPDPEPDPVDPPEDAMYFVRVDGDVAQYLVNGNRATWVRTPTEKAAMVDQFGLDPAERIVQRSFLKLLWLDGPQPQYNPPAVHTSAADFANG